MKIILIFLSTIIFATFPQFALAGDGHDDHGTEEKGHKHQEGEDSDHKDEENHGEAKEGSKKDEHDDHGEGEESDHAEHKETEEHEEGGAAVGPDKGILEKGPLGIKLSPEAVKTFELKFSPVTSTDFELPREALVEIRDGQYVYLINDNWISRVKAEVLAKTATHFKVRVSAFKAPSQVIIQGVGFVRGAELIAAEGATHSH
jgi:cobalamin biosynthesis protein CobT